MKILIIEDEKRTAAYLRKGFTEQGFVADLAENGEDGLYSALAAAYDFIVLSLGLSGRDGWSVLEGIRQAQCSTPVLLLAPRDAVHEHVKGLEMGADDYLVKPFAFSELLARAHSILRRAPLRQTETLHLADLEIDFMRHKVSRASRRLDLTFKEFALISLLARRAGEVLSRALIVEQIWDMNFDSNTNVVDVLVRRLRLKVDDPFRRKLVHTVRGVGYVLEDRG